MPGGVCCDATWTEVRCTAPLRFIAPLSKDTWCMLGDGLLARELLEAMLCTGSICSGGDSSASAIAPVSSSGDTGGRDKTPTLTISSDRSSCCLYSRAFIEHISLLLQEKGSSEAMRDERLMEG